MSKLLCQVQPGDCVLVNRILFRETWLLVEAIEVIGTDLDKTIQLRGQGRTLEGRFFRKIEVF